MDEVRPIDWFYQYTFVYEIFDIGTVNDAVEGQMQLIALVAGPAFGRRGEANKLSFRFPVFLEIVDDALIASPVRRDTMSLVNDDQVRVGHCIGQHFLRAHIRRKEYLVILEGRPFI